MLIKIISLNNKLPNNLIAKINSTAILARQGHKGAQAFILKQLKSKDPAVRLVTAQKLDKISTRKKGPVFKRAYKKEKNPVLRAVLAKLTEPFYPKLFLKGKYGADLSIATSKYITETEKNLKKLYSASESSNTVIFFNEADDLFGRKKKGEE